MRALVLALLVLTPLGSAAGLPRRYDGVPAKAERGFLGIQIAGDPRSDTVLVRAVAPGGPGDRAGLRAGDRILALDGRRMRGAESVREDFDALRAGRNAHLRVARGGREREVDVRLVPRGALERERRPVARPRPFYVRRREARTDEVRHEIRRLLHEYEHFLAEQREELRALAGEVEGRRAPRERVRTLGPAGELRRELDEMRREVEEMRRALRRLRE